ncbi:MAG: tRNA-dihydrouridine synthase [Candidatus Nomurabacteria bacterium GW2011_GWE1_32_28]|uniref:tRNA-dihydrouridine synthase n=1 Tax=Candidatus Nomurabacteria bacterium GW2011_GWF1_31_48 TaxID=1618767 RepID=A0A0F9YH37_9BACT|nr:MAG: tRNA-dihydrouridine synthase [Candidatus Nomurabacteria bacterium GW2011_GWF2_30_133]KKP28985.1 MAG: tRNA-dihydrouridine synthase [Candidatus Nomurabacteria bacterium GW2011_GWE2_31_40]KKP30723.1 MAG: tRNA-dihydrouridine synthase [Candidatus Nomurabacteria bacterium GW2011_GWF1_31_48]KKP35241.1 MAG: tRNA-dihydrouridine synthase [Candidatus Nomurabacteria bacterium GW2011_GWE1_32_28]HAS80548.1 tRNA-dihydrouridine synthase [Candidatus Nomurabacteria bacterium]
MSNFWKKLNKPFFCLAPMSDVTDIAFRRILAKYSKNRENKDSVVFWTEFVAADGLCNKLAKKKLSYILKYSEAERPIVAQVFGANPENMEKACSYIASLGFDGIDINMGCPDKSVVAQGAGSGLIKTPQLARKIIQAAHRGIESSGANIPVSVKTRIGFNKKEELDMWIGELVKENISALTIHLRTTKELSLVPANWDHIKRIKEIIKDSGKEILLIGNGDVKDLKDAESKALEYGCDGVMIGRGVFGNPFFFTKKNVLSEVEGLSSDYIKNDELKEKLEILIEHTQIFDKELLKPKYKNFSVMKKHFKAYVNDFPGAKELRVKLMETDNSKEVENIINEFLKQKK